MQGSSSSSGTDPSKLGDARAASAYDRLVSSAFNGVVERLEKLEEGVVVLAPCGCSRAELLKRLLKPGEQVFARAYVYRESLERKLSFRERVKEVEEYVEEYRSLEELIKELKGWSGGRVAVVPESSCEAVALKQMLEKEAPYLRVQLLYLPQLYREAAEGYSGDVKELARVKHSSLGKAYGCEAEGYSSTLLREWGEQLEKLEEAKEAVLKLSPGTLGLSDYLRDVGVKALAELGAAVFGVPVALAMERVLRPVAQLSLSGAASALLDRVRKIPSGRVEELVSRVLVSLAKPEARDKVAEGLARFIASARG
ncbi:MAG: hypothetical protein LM576_08450, partial [Thermofilum sp.]|nr:hypothetical protein [Thermofilum sp.]